MIHPTRPPSPAWRFRALGATLALLLSATVGNAESLSFSATGCGPYALKEEPLLESYIDMVNKDGKSEFLIHLGDVVSGSKKKWPESQYEKVADILKKSTRPVFVVPGDNEWNDLDDPAEGWRFWTKHFLHFEKHWDKAPKLAKQPVRPENMAWAAKGVLMIGINLPGGRVHDKEEWKTRMNQDADWVRECFKKWDKDVRACVLFAQATPIKDHEPFFKQFVEDARAFAKPTLYIHADGHVWQVQKNWRGLPNLLRVQTDQVSKAPPVLVTITDDAKEPFVFDRRLPKK